MLPFGQFFLVLAPTFILGLLCAGIATAQPRGELVALPNGDTVAIGAEGGRLLQAHDAGGLEAVLWQLLDEGRPGDAVAVLAYVARHRAAAAGALTVMGLRIVTDLQDAAGAGEMVSAILQESGADPAAVRAAVQAAGLPAEAVDAAAGQATDRKSPPKPELAEGGVAEDDEVAALEPASQYLPEGDAPPALPDPPVLADLPAKSPSFGAHGGERSGFGGGLPAGLVIGGGNGGGTGDSVPDVKDPPADGGVS